MLVFISDLHISDQTTGVQFLDLGAFCEALSNIGRQAAQAGSQEVVFVFLGDIFDMVRTTFWTVPDQQRGFWQNPRRRRPANGLIAPWDVDVNTDDLKAASLELLGTIIEKNREIFDLWGGKIVGRRVKRIKEGDKVKTVLLQEGEQDEEGTSQLIWPCSVEPRRVYVPGNHDRILNQFPELRYEVIKALGLNTGLTDHLNANEPFPHFYANESYKVFARHGQEWDHFNFEHCQRWKDPAFKVVPDDYLDIPIGEIIANEFSRLPTEVGKKLSAQWLKGSGGNTLTKAQSQQLQRIEEQLNVVDDVRPPAAVVPWLFDSVSTNPILTEHREELLGALVEALADSADRLEDLPFVQAWLLKHDRPFAFDETEQVQLVLEALQAVRSAYKSFGRFFDVYRLIRNISQKLAAQSQGASGSNSEQEALKDLWRVRAMGGKYADTLYILYGHTHRAAQVPLTVPDVPNANSGGSAAAKASTTTPACAVYLNTGTWRPLATQAQDQNGFMRWKSLTFTLFYEQGQDPDSEARPGSPTFETWSGTLLSPLT